MLGYAQNAPALANQDYTDIANVAASGDAQRAYEQQLLSAPYQQMLQFGQLIQPGTSFGTQTQTQPVVFTQRKEIKIFVDIN
jgi:hypothetical protein